MLLHVFLPSVLGQDHTFHLSVCPRWAASHRQSETMGSLWGSLGEVWVAAGSGGWIQWLPVDHVGAAAWTQSDCSTLSAACVAAHIKTCDKNTWLRSVQSVCQFLVQDLVILTFYFLLHNSVCLNSLMKPLWLLSLPAASPQHHHTDSWQYWRPHWSL